MEPLHLTRFHLTRRTALSLVPAGLALLAQPARAAGAPLDVLIPWYRLVLELVRHTPTYSPPVASRAFAYLGVTVWEVLAGIGGHTSLSGQLNALTPPPAPAPGLDPAAALHGALSVATAHFFGNTGPTGQRAMAAMDRQMLERLAPDAASLAHGQAVAAHVIAWAADDGGAVVENLGFPDSYTLGTQPGAWVPTSLIRLQQTPLLPGWGANRPFAMSSGADCGLPPPPAYDETPGSPLHAEAMEVYQTSKSLTEEQKIIARFWSDDPMLSPTPPGHWIVILLDIAERDGMSAEMLASTLARLGVGIADAFIACWHEKFRHDFLRPVTYIRRVIDPAWEPLLITPPFPEYPSGHSTQSGAAAAVLTAALGDGFAFDDHTHVDDGLPVRSFPSFAAAAEEAALSRLYGGIHFRSGNRWGLEQGACVGAHAVALKTL